MNSGKVNVRPDIFLAAMVSELSDSEGPWLCWWVEFSAPGKWGCTQMGSVGFSRIFTGLYILGPARVRAVPFETHDFKGFQPDFSPILTGL